MKKFLLFLSGIAIYYFAQAQITAPVPTYPADSAPNVPVNVIMTWNPSLGAPVASYEAQIASDFGMTNPVAVTTKGASAHTKELMFNTTYYWHARGKTSGGQTSSWTTTRRFTTFNNQFKNLIPEDSTVLLVNINDSIKWDTISGVTHYQVELSKYPSMMNATSFTVAHPVRSVGIQNLEFNTDYFFRVRAWHAKDTSGWSSVHPFRTIARIELTSPSNNAVNRDPLISLNCENSPGIIAYRYELNTSGNFDTTSTEYFFEVLQDADFSKDEDIKWIVDRLLFDTTYYWRVKAVSMQGTAAWSKARKFKTLDKIRLLEPADSAINVKKSSYLKWDGVKGVGDYSLEFDTDSNFSNPIQIEETKDSLKIPVSLKNGVQYFWRVRAGHIRDQLEWSDYRNFTTLSVGVEETADVRSFEIYPNPAGEIFYIKSVAAITEKFDLKIFNANGSLVKSFPNLKFNGGSPIGIDMSELETGLYMINILQDDTSHTYRISKQ